MSIPLLCSLGALLLDLIHAINGRSSLWLAITLLALGMVLPSVVRWR